MKRSIGQSSQRQPMYIRLSWNCINTAHCTKPQQTPDTSLKSSSQLLSALSTNLNHERVPKRSVVRGICISSSSSFPPAAADFAVHLPPKQHEIAADLKLAAYLYIVLPRTPLQKAVSASVECQPTTAELQLRNLQ
jgi:hypothetical protein